MWQAIKLTFGSVWGWLGIIVAAISLINLGVMYFEVGIGPVLERVVGTYKAIVHRGVDLVFFWVDWEMPSWFKDILALWVVFASATARGRIAGMRVDGMRINAAGEVSTVGKVIEFITAFPAWPVLAAAAAKILWLSWGQARIRGFTHAQYVSSRAVLVNFVAIPSAVILVVLFESGI